MQNDDKGLLDVVKRRIAADPLFRHELEGFLHGSGKSENLLEAHLDQTLRSPRLRALFEQSRASSKGR